MFDLVHDSETVCILYFENNGKINSNNIPIYENFII